LNLVRLKTEYLNKWQTRIYHALHEDKIFMGGAADVEDMVKNEGVQVVVDLLLMKGYTVRLSGMQGRFDSNSPW
jgi:hypothetical protein